MDRSAIRLTWDEILQPAATGFKLYRYIRGSRAVAIATLGLEDLEYIDRQPGTTSPVFYYLTTVGDGGVESRAGEEVAVIMKK